jgi:hypothetical protein
MNVKLSCGSILKTDKVAGDFLYRGALFRKGALRKNRWRLVGLLDAANRDQLEFLHSTAVVPGEAALSLKTRWVKFLNFTHEVLGATRHCWYEVAQRRAARPDDRQRGCLIESSAAITP